MVEHSITSDEIIERTMQNVAPLPCQESYIRQLASILSMHIHRNHLMDEGYLVDDLPPVSAIVVAPTGQGKTFLLRKMTESLGLNLIVVDCSTLAAEGWKGVGLAERLLLSQKNSNNADEFERSILFLDEVDKLRFWGTNSDQGNPMSNILQLYNAGYVTAEDSRKEAVNIDIRRFTVLLGGAFDGLSSIVGNRIQPKSKIGFDRDENSEERTKLELFQQVTNNDLIAYGMLPELLGRIGTILTIPPLGVDDYRQLLQAKTGSVQFQYNNYLRGLYGVGFELTDAAVGIMAQKCMGSNSGTRAVMPLMNDLMRGAIAAVERDKTVCQVVIDTNEEDLFVRYKYGNRGYCFRDPERRGLPEHTVKAKSTAALTGKLCRYYRKAGGDLKILPVLQAFLECSLEYLSRYAPREDLCFNSLEKLARVVRTDRGGSTFEMLLCARNVGAYERFQNYYTQYTQRYLVSALQQIMDYLESYHQKVTIRFALTRRP